jgi:dTDP-4-amino-4,6-dideoxygalactose transaminase
VTPRTRAVIATHMHGYPADMAAIRREIGDERILLIEDAALALRPAQTDAMPVADVTLFSFGRGKQLYTISGGVLVTNSASLYERVKAYRDAEMNRLPASVWRRRSLQVLTAYLAQSAILETALSRLKETGPVKQARDAVGLVRAVMPRDYATPYADFQGRLGLAQLDKLEQVLARNSALAEFYSNELADVAGITPAPIIPGAAYARYALRVERRDEIGFSRRMYALGVEVGLNFNYALPCLEPYRAYARGYYPRAEQAAVETVNLPLYPGLQLDEAHYAAECVRKVMQARHN